MGGEVKKADDLDSPKMALRVEFGNGAEFVCDSDDTSVAFVKLVVDGVDYLFNEEDVDALTRFLLAAGNVY